MWRVPAWAVALGVGMWVADVFVPAYRIDGPTWARLLAGGAVAVVVLAVAAAMILPLTLVIGTVWLAGASRGLARELEEDWPDDWPDDPVDGEPPPAPPPPRPPSAATTVLAGLLFAVAGVVVVMPVAFVAGVRVVGFFGGPVDLDGGWAVWLTAGLVFWAVFDAVRGLISPARAGKPGESAPRRWLARQMSVLGVAAVLWLAVEALPGVRLAAGDRPAPVDVLVLAAMIVALRVAIPGRAGVIVQVVVDVVVLGTVVWAGTWLARPLEFDGWWPMALVAVAVTAILHPVRLIAPAPPPIPTITRTRL